jgi:predicted nucleic acid binding AN1-type Zn finger protein
MIDRDVIAAMRRMTHASYMQTVLLVHNVMPTEELRNEIDGPDICPERRRFARTIELFECELRAPAPGIDWETLTRGAGCAELSLRANHAYDGWSTSTSQLQRILPAGEEFSASMGYRN